MPLTTSLEPSVSSDPVAAEEAPETLNLSPSLLTLLGVEDAQPGDTISLKVTLGAAGDPAMGMTAEPVAGSGALDMGEPEAEGFSHTDPSEDPENAPPPRPKPGRKGPKELGMEDY